MKKIIFIIIAIFVATIVSSQSTSPRFGTLKNQDNTFRTLTNKVVAVTDVAGTDSLIIKANAYNTIVKIAMLDSLYLKTPTVTNCYYGDNLTIILVSTTGTPKLKIATGGNWISAGTATLSTGLRGVITFIFDGAKWVEKSRVIQ